MAGTKLYPNKILMTTDTVGGVWTYCLELCRSLDDAQFHLVTTGKNMSDTQRAELDELSNVVVSETDYKLEWMDNPWQDVDESGEWLLKLEEEVQPDIIHLNSYSYASLPFNAPKVVVAHSDVFSWFYEVKNEAPGSEWSTYFDRVKAGLNSADIVIAPSCSVLSSLQKIYNVEGRTRVIYNGRSSSFFERKEKQPVIFTMGRIWDEAKNIQLLVDAAPGLSYDIRIAGEQRFEKEFLSAHADNLQFIGKVSLQKIQEHLSTASIFVLPAKYEPFGLSPLEAALSGCALVLGDISSLREIWDDAAVYVETSNPAHLAKVINDLLEDTERLTEMQSKAFDRAQLYSSEKMAEEYKHLYTNFNEYKLANLKPEVA
jgi:glycogen synthase